MDTGRCFIGLCAAALAACSFPVADPTEGPAVSVRAPVAPASGYAFERHVYADAALCNSEDSNGSPDCFVIEGLRNAMAEWEAVTPVRFTFIDILPTQALLNRQAAGGDANAIFVVASWNDTGCPTGTLPGDLLGDANPYPYVPIEPTAETICVVVNAIISQRPLLPGQDVVKEVFAHEIGHALGMSHEGANELMFYQLGPNQTDHLTCGDLVQFSVVSGAPLPDDCIPRLVN